MLEEIKKEYQRTIEILSKLSGKSKEEIDNEITRAMSEKNFDDIVKKYTGGDNE